MGEFIKGCGGDVTVKNEQNSQRNVDIYEKMFPTGWNFYKSVAPGSSVDFNVNGDLKFEVPNKEFRSASDVQGGFDVHFDDVWMSLRNK